MNTNNITHQLTALDAEEAAEWRESVQSLLQASGPQAVRQVMDMLSEMARNPAIGWKPTRSTPYINTIATSRRPAFPGDLRSRNGWPR